MGEERFAVISDAHAFIQADLAERNRRKQEGVFPAGEEFFSIFLSRWARDPKKNIDYFYKMGLKIASLEERYGAFDGVIDGGDATFGVFNEGLVNPEAIQERMRYNEILSSFFRNGHKKSFRKYFAWGNHDVGFQNGITKFLNDGQWQEGMSIKSFHQAEKYIGPAWQSVYINGYTILILNSEIVRAYHALESVDESEKDFFVKKYEEQKKFLSDSLEQAMADMSLVILVIHDPMQLYDLWHYDPEIMNRVTLSGVAPRISGTFTGHFHMVTLTNKLVYYPGRGYMYRNLKLYGIPSPWASGGRIFCKIAKKNAGGFASLVIPEEPDINSPLNVKRHWL